MTQHTDTTHCGLTREDFHPDGDEPCVDGGQPEEHPPLYFPTARIPLPSDEYVATHPEEYSYDEARQAWDRLDQDTRDRLEREFEEAHPEMSEPYIPGANADDRWPTRPVHLW